MSTKLLCFSVSPPGFKWCEHYPNTLVAFFIRGRAVDEILCYKPDCRGFQTLSGNLMLSIYPSFWTHYALGFTQPLTEMSIRAENKKMFLRVQRGRWARPPTPPSSVSRLSRQCGIFNISYRPLLPVTGIASLLYM
jgi:hypothetical protein